MKTKFYLALVVFGLLSALGCGTSPTKNTSVGNANSGEKANISNANSANAVPKSDTDELASLLPAIPFAQLVPNIDAKLENGKETSAKGAVITLPADWKKTKCATESDTCFAPAKPAEDGITELVLSDMAPVDEQDKPLSDPKDVMLTYLRSAKKQKEDGKIDAYGTRGVARGTSDSPQAPTAGVTILSDRAGQWAETNGKCSTEKRINCADFSWKGFGKGDIRVAYLTIYFQPGSFEKNKATIDAILNSYRIF